MNITLIGMPGAGKSTVGVVLSKIMNLNFTDTDILLQQAHGKKLSEMISEKGADSFLDEESLVITKHAFQDTVIATGGSVIYRPETMAYLKSISKIIYINVSLSEIEKRVKSMAKRGVVSLNAGTIAELYAERMPLYEQYADLTVCTDGCTLEESAVKIAEMFEI